jgi:hypothetical protein
MFFFPYCLHLNGAEGLNFIDLLFEKIIYNLEVEMTTSMQEAKTDNLDESDNDSDEENENNLKTNKNPYLNNDSDKKSRKSKKNETQMRYTRPAISANIGKMFKVEDAKTIKNTRSNKDFGLNTVNINNAAEKNNNDCSNNNLGLADSSRLMLNKEHMSKRGKMHIPSSVMVDEQITGSSLESNLLRRYHNVFANQIQNGFVRKVSFEVFKEIMFVYFHNNIVQFLKAFKDILTEFKDNLVYNVKEIDKDRIDLSLLTSRNIHKFLNNTYEKKLFGIRDNIKRDPNNDAETFLTFDDIYVYMKNNYYFYNCKELYCQFSRDSSI